MDDELKILLPGEQFSLSNGDTIMVSPIPFGKLRLFSGAVASLMQKLSEQGLKLEGINDYQVIFDVAFEETLKIMSLALDRPREWFDAIDLADGLGLLNIIIGQNFNDRSKKNLKGLLQKMGGLLQTQSRPSSPQATHGPKLRAIQPNRSGPSAGASPNSKDMPA